MRILLLLATLLVAMPAFAQNWSTRSLEPGERAVYEWQDAATDPNTALDASRCAETSWQYSDDTTSNGDTTAAASLYHCEDPSALPADARCSLVQGFTNSTTAPIVLTLRPGFYRLDVTSATAAGSNARVMGYCTMDYAGATAPGLVGSLATMETLEYIWGLERVPFPSKIDRGQWRTYYFSFDASGDWPAGANANDGLTPATPKASITGAGGAKEVCLGFEDSLNPGGPTGGFVKCIFDWADDWSTATGGYGNTWGEIVYEIGVREDMDPTGCPTGFETARAQPCFWMAASPGGRVHFDATGSVVNAPCLSWEPISIPVHLLWEAIDHTCASTNEKTVWDTQEAGIFTVVASAGNTISAPASGQVGSAHDFSVTHLYGNSTTQYTTPICPCQTFGLNGSGAIAVHTRNLLEGAIVAAQSTSLSLAQGTGATNSILRPYVQVNPAVMLVTGAHLRNGVTSNNANSVPINHYPACDEPGSADNCATIEYSSWVRTWLVNVYLENFSAAPNSYYYKLDSNGVAPAVKGRSDLYMSHVTFSDNSSVANEWTNVVGVTTDFAPGDILNYHGAGILFETKSPTQQLFRIVDQDFADNSASTLRLYDWVHDPQANSLRIFSGVTANCDTSTPALCEAANPGNMTTDGRLVINTTWASAAGVDQAYALPDKGICDAVTPRVCAGLANSPRAVYSQLWDDRLAIPAFIAGRRVVGFYGQPELYPNAGVVR